MSRTCSLLAAVKNSISRKVNMTSELLLTSGDEGFFGFVQGDISSLATPDISGECENGAMPLNGRLCFTSLTPLASCAGVRHSVLHHPPPSLLCQVPGCDCMASLNSPLSSPDQPPVHTIDPSVLTIQPEMSSLNTRLLKRTASVPVGSSRPRQHVRTRREPAEDTSAFAPDHDPVDSSACPSTAGCDQGKKRDILRRAKSIPRSMVSKGKRGPGKKKAQTEEQRVRLEGEAPIKSPVNTASPFTFIDESSQIAAAVAAEDSTCGNRRRKRSGTTSVSALRWSEDISEQNETGKTVPCARKAPSTARKRVKKDQKEENWSSAPASAARLSEGPDSTLLQSDVLQVTTSPLFRFRPFCPPALPLPQTGQPATMPRQNSSEETGSICAYPSSSLGCPMNRQFSSELMTSLTRSRPTCHRRTSSYPVSSLRSSQYGHEGVEGSSYVTLPRLMANLPPPPGPKPAPIEPRPGHSCDRKVCGMWDARPCLYIGHHERGC